MGLQYQFNTKVDTLKKILAVELLAIVFPTFGKEAILDQGYWLGREDEDFAIVLTSTIAKDGMPHLNLAQRHSINAADTGRPSLVFPSHSEVHES